MDITAKVALFETDGTVFLAEDLIKGLPLRQWVSERVGTSIEGVPKLTEVLAIARGLVDVVGRVHRAGWVLRDLTPNNIMVTSDGSLRLMSGNQARNADLAAATAAEGQPSPTATSAS